MGVISRIEQGRAIRRTRICAASLDGENSRYNGTNKKRAARRRPQLFLSSGVALGDWPEGGPFTCRLPVKILAGFVTLHHAAHATHAAHIGHAASSGCAGFFRLVGNHGFGGDQQASDRASIL